MWHSDSMDAIVQHCNQHICLIKKHWYKNKDERYDLCLIGHNILAVLPRRLDSNAQGQSMKIVLSAVITRETVG